MRPVSAAWGRTILGSHRAIYRAFVCETFESAGYNPIVRTLIPIQSGEVVLDGTARIRGTLDLTTAGKGMWPTRARALLAPYGNEIFVERGIQYTDALVEYKSLGYFRINTIEQDEPSDGSIRITASDRMGRIVKARMLAPRQFPAGTPLWYIVETLVAEVYPQVQIIYEGAAFTIFNTTTTTRSLVAEDDRYDFLDELIRSYGCIWQWEPDGALHLKPQPSPTKPVWEIHSGPDGVMTKVARRLTDEEVYNAVVASGEATDTFDPPRAVAYDSNPNSPTFYGGRFGPTPYFFTSAAIQTRGQAASAAQAELRRRLGLPHSMDLSAVPNPALEPWDLVSVRVPGEGRQTHMLDTIRIPLQDGAAMEATTREQTSVLITTS